MSKTRHRKSRRGTNHLISPDQRESLREILPSGIEPPKDLGGLAKIVADDIYSKNPQAGLDDYKKYYEKVGLTSLDAVDYAVTMSKALHDQSVPLVQRKKSAEFFRRDLDTRIEKIKIEHDQTRKDRDRLELMHLALEDMLDWSKGFIDPLTALQKNEHSRLHLLIEAFKHQQVLDFDAPNGADWLESSGTWDWKETKTFVIRHNWLAAMGEHLGDVSAEEWRLPFTRCAFEFQVAGRTVILLAREDEGEYKIVWTPMFQGPHNVWLTYDEPAKGYSDYVANLVQQVRVICVMLDSEVAEHELIRQPIKLNEKRVKNNRQPLLDYRVVDLSRRIRAQRNPNSIPTGQHRRLHFRRGHWRHYTEHRVWIKWQMVGNPDLGFIDSQYRL